jgi:hypothetical protein
MRVKLSGVALVLWVIGATSASAQGLRAVKPLDGWACMKLNLSEQQSLDPSVHISVRAAPNASAAQAGSAAMTVAVRSPAHDVNGYQEMLFPSGKHVWIATKDIVPWSSLSDPSARCVPSMMSNGKPGFAYPH